MTELSFERQKTLVVLETRAYVRGRMGEGLGTWGDVHKDMSLMVPILVAHTEGADVWRAERGLPPQIDIALDWAREKQADMALDAQTAAAAEQAAAGTGR